MTEPEKRRDPQRDTVPHVPAVRARLVGGPRDGQLIETPLVNGLFLRSHVAVVTEGYAAVYRSPLDFDPSSVVDFIYDNIVTCDGIPVPPPQRSSDARGDNPPAPATV